MDRRRKRTKNRALKKKMALKRDQRKLQNLFEIPSFLVFFDSIGDDEGEISIAQKAIIRTALSSLVPEASGISTTRSRVALLSNLLITLRKIHGDEFFLCIEEVLRSTGYEFAEADE